MRILLVALLLVAAVACDGDGAGGGGESPERVDDGRALPPEVDAFLDRVAAPGEVAFAATYEVLAKLGGERLIAHVASAPPRVRIDVEGSATVVLGPGAFSCATARRSCAPGVDDRVMNAYVHSGFFSTGPANRLSTAARRTGAGEATTSSRPVAGVDLDCLHVPFGARVALTACLTDEGVFGYVDDATQTMTLTAYAPGAPTGASFEPPFPLGPPDPQTSTTTRS